MNTFNFYNNLLFYFGFQQLVTIPFVAEKLLLCTQLVKLLQMEKSATGSLAKLSRSVTQELLCKGVKRHTRSNA